MIEDHGFLGSHLNEASKSDGNLKELHYLCRWCPCVFSTRADLERHLEVFGDSPHFREWRETRSRYDLRRG